MFIDSNFTFKIDRKEIHFYSRSEIGVDLPVSPMNWAILVSKMVDWLQLS